MKKNIIKRFITQVLVFVFSFMYVGILFGQTATVTIGTGISSTSATGPTPFGSYYHDDRTQLLYLASELQAAGLTAGNITMIAFDVASASSQSLNNFKVKIKHTTATYLSGFESMISTFYSGAPTVSTGWNNFYAGSNFYWNGTDNIIVEVSFDNTSYTSSSSIRYTSTGSNLVWSKYSDSGAGTAEYMTGGSGYTQRANIKITGASVPPPPPLPIVIFPADVNLSGDASPNYSYNFIHVMSPLTDLGDNGEMVETINYFDGLGKPMQSTLHEASGDETKDIIIPIIYDAFGRQDKEYLPFAATENGNIHADPTNISNYTGYYGTTEDDFVFAEKHLEASPLNRVLEQGAPGQTWQLNKTSDTDKTIKFDFETNITSEVRLWTIDNNGDLITSGYYINNRLYKTIIKDENWTSGTDHTTEEFKDMQGRVILKRTYDSSASNPKHDTYYVYDDYGNLSFVLPPKAEGTTSTSISSTVLTELCYQYTYDHRNRLIEKKIPGKGKENIVYDLLDRPVMTQDSIHSGTEWLFTKYDALGRIIYTGIYSSNSNRSTLQTTFDGKSNEDMYETKLTTTGTLGIYYSNIDFPAFSLDVLTVNYYDNYDFDISRLGVIPTIVQGEAINTSAARGLPTGSRIKVLDTSNWITTATYYDNNARAIYTTSDNAYLDTQDIVENELDFRGKVTKLETSHTKGLNNPIEIIENFDYDDMERLLTHKHQIVGEFQETLAINTYDELGQLISKGVGNVSSSGTRLQTIDYTYNIRGWLKQINDVNNLGSTDLFAFEINYNDIADVNKRLYNGNISQTFWKTANTDSSLKDYEYTYDALNRITSGLITNSNSSENNKHNLKLVEYDKNGNITKLRRNGYRTDGVFDEYLDHLTYNYDSGNKLVDILEEGHHYEGFSDGSNNQTGDYDYDVNGNLMTDANKGITNISYNFLNLPETVTINNNSDIGIISYIYDATGVKLQKTVNNTGESSVTITDYVGNYVYENDQLQFFNHAEGYTTPDGSGGFDYVYQYLDHLGNIRISYSDNVLKNGIIGQNEIIEENNYYPFGLKHKGYNSSVSSNVNSVAKKFKYNGVELEESFDLNLYEMPFRQYDPTIGRFTSIDPVIHYTQSTYVAFDNNPAFWADPSGAYSTREWMKDNGITDEDVTTIYQAPSNDSSDDSNDKNNEDCCGGLLDLIISYSGIGKNLDEMSNGTGQTNYSQEEIDSRDESRKSEALKSVTINKPDALGVDVNLSLGAWAGGDHTFSAIWILNGGSKSSYPYVFYSAQGHASDGADFSLTMGVSAGKYYGNQTYSIKDIPGSYSSGEVGFGSFVVGNINYTQSQDRFGEQTWSFGSINFGVGLNLSPISGANIKVGKGKTRAIFNY